MTYNVFSGTLNPTHSLTQLCRLLIVVYSIYDNTEIKKSSLASN